MKMTFPCEAVKVDKNCVCVGAGAGKGGKRLSKGAIIGIFQGFYAKC